MKYSVFVLLFSIVIFSCEKDDNDPVVSSGADSVAIGAGYTNDIFYSLENGEILSKSRNQWDIAFSTGVMSWSILINSSSGVELYHVSSDTNDFHTITDSVDFSTWTRLHNSLTDWSVGAFMNMGAITNPFDFVWGIYNPSNHNVYGAAVYVVKLGNGERKKFFIRMKNGMTNTFDFLYADINGDNEKHATLALNTYNNKEYAYYSLTTNNAIDYEPAKIAWDLLFNSYIDPNVPMPVAGVLSKPGVKVLKVAGVPHEQADTLTGQFSSAPAVIGYNWKTYDYMANKYTIAEDVTYFIKTENNKVFKLYFTAFGGSANGKFVFYKEKIK